MGPSYWTVIENLWEAIGELGIKKILVGKKDKENSPGKTKYFLFKYLRQLTFIPFSPSKSKIQWDFFAC